MSKKLSCQDRKQAILNAAIPIFAKLGFKSTTTKEIAQSAGISEALLYKHFSSKCDLYDQIQHKFCEKSQELAGDLSKKNLGGENIIEAISLIGFSLCYGLDGQEQFSIVRKLIMNSLITDGVFAEKFLDSHFRPWQTSFELNLKKAQELNQMHANRSTFHQNSIWIIHNLFSGLLFYINQPQIKLFENKKQYLKDCLLFCLRGVGFKEEFIQVKFDFEQIYNQYQIKFNIKES